MRNYYNENDPFAAAWLRELIAESLITPGYVDERSIEDVKPADLDGFIQCHFFAGIGGWAYALRLAGWPDDRAVWTGSCPCQPISSAGQRKGHADKRHLWPAFHRLISERKPPIVFGEQVASKDGREWFAGVRADLEALGYACGCADLCAAGIGSPHPRQRLYWVAESESIKLTWRTEQREHPSQVREAGQSQSPSLRRSSGVDKAPRMGESTLNRLETGLAVYGEHDGQGFDEGCKSDLTRLEHADELGKHGRTPGGKQPICNEDGESIEGLGDSEGKGFKEQRGIYQPSGERCSGLSGFAVQAGVPEWNGPTIAVECSDGWRRVSAKPNAFPLAHGVPARMGKLRGAGNAICPHLAQIFIEEWLKT